MQKLGRLQLLLRFDHAQAHENEGCCDDADDDPRHDIPTLLVDLRHLCAPGDLGDGFPSLLGTLTGNSSPFFQAGCQDHMLCLCPPLPGQGC